MESAREHYQNRVLNTSFRDGSMMFCLVLYAISRSRTWGVLENTDRGGCCTCPFETAVL